MPDKTVNIALHIRCFSVESDWVIPPVWTPTVFDETTFYPLANHATCGTPVLNSDLTFKFYDTAVSTTDELSWVTSDGS